MLKYMLKYQIDVLNNLDKKEKEANELMDQYIYPTKDILQKAFSILEKYIRDNNKIIYGGTAIDLLIKRYVRDWNISNDIYPDYDFYSSEPIKDLHNICNLIHKEGIEVKGFSAMHEGTYKIIIGHRIEFADITYVPLRLLGTMDTISINNMNYVKHKISLIDQYRRISNPLDGSLYKIEKTMKRLFMIENIIRKGKTITKPILEEQPREIKSIIKKLKNEIKKYDKLIITGNICFNIIVKLLGSKYEKYLVDERYIEVYSQDYLTLAQNLIKFVTDSSSVELQPFFQYYEKGVYIVYKNYVVAKIYNTTRCLPYIETSIGYICSIDLLREYLLSRRVWELQNKYKVNARYSEYIYELSLLLEDEYNSEFKESDKGDNILERLRVHCIGKTEHAKVREQREIIRKIKLKRPGRYNYNPSNIQKNVDEIKIPDFKHPNISGAYVYNEKGLNLKSSIIPQNNLIM